MRREVSTNGKQFSNIQWLEERKLASVSKIAIDEAWAEKTKVKVRASLKLTYVEDHHTTSTVFWFMVAAPSGEPVGIDMDCLNQFL